MTSSLIDLRLPSWPNQRIILPYFPRPPAPIGRKLVNGTLIVTNEADPTRLYKFSAWTKSELAFNETDIYSRLRDIEDPSGVVQLFGVSGTAEHFVRIVERSHEGALNNFLFGQAKGDHRAIDSGFARSLLAQIAEAMATIHALNIVHRDIKAENILMFDGGRAKVSDFDRAVELAGAARLERPVGSLFHMAPELLRWEKYDRKIDVYAFGILMFEVAHGGARPYGDVATGMPGSLSSTEFADKVVEETHRPDWKHEDAALKNLASRCWAANPDDRPEFGEIFECLSPGPRRPAARLPLLAAPSDVGVASDIGKERTSLEDSACVLAFPGGLIAGIFDGIRGERASELAARQFAISLVDGMETWETAMSNAFGRMESSLREIDPDLDCGSTAVVAVLRRNDLLVSWLGDSPAYLFRKAETGTRFIAIPLVDRHLPGRADEAARVAANDGIVDREKRWLDNGEKTPWGPLRVFAPKSGRSEGIALSRALGLFPFKPEIGDMPEMIRLDRQDDDLFVVLGSDGLFEILDLDTIHRTVIAADSAQGAADALIESALIKGAPDNVTAIVIDMGGLQNQ